MGFLYAMKEYKTHAFLHDGCWLFWGFFLDKYVFCDVFSLSLPSFVFYPPPSMDGFLPSLPTNRLTNTNRFNGCFAIPSIRCTEWDDTTIMKTPLGLWGESYLFYAVRMSFLLSLFVPPPFLVLPFPVFLSPSLFIFPPPFLSLLTPP